MKQIGENIAHLRRTHGMTQEELAAAIGVTAQSVSKWETGTTMPDIMLLPVIADIFSITVDSLYGRVKESEPITREEIFSDTVDTLLKGICLYMAEDQDAEKYSKYRQALADDPHTKTGIMRCGEGSVFYCEQTGAVLLKKQQDGLFRSETACEVLDLLGSSAFRHVLQHVVDAGCGSLTAASVAKREGCERDTAQGYLETLKQWGIVRASACDLGDEKVTVYYANEFARNKIFMLEVISAYAQELAYKKNYLYCWGG